MQTQELVLKHIIPEEAPLVEKPEKNEKKVKNFTPPKPPKPPTQPSTKPSKPDLLPTTMGAMGIVGGRDRAIRLGDTVSLISIDTFARFFPGLTNTAARLILKKFNIPVVFIGSMGYFNQYTLEKVFYSLTQPNKQNFAMPGSNRKRQIQKKGTVKDTRMNPTLAELELIEQEKPKRKKRSSRG